MHYDCKSFNKENNGDMKCELNKKTSEDWKDTNFQVVKRSGWTFVSTDYNFPQVTFAARELKGPWLGRAAH